MESTFIYYNNLTFNDEKEFLIDFSDEDLLEDVVIEKNKDYYIISMTRYVDLTVDITKLPNNTKFKETSDLVNATLRGGIDFGYGKKNMALEKLVDLALCFHLANLEEINTSKTLNFSTSKIKNKKTYIFIWHTKS